MGMSFSTVEEKKQVRWFVMRAYKIVHWHFCFVFSVRVSSFPRFC